MTCSYGIVTAWLRHGYGTVRSQLWYSYGTVTSQLRHSYVTVTVQLRYSYDTVTVQLLCPFLVVLLHRNGDVTCRYCAIVKPFTSRITASLSKR